MPWVIWAKAFRGTALVKLELVFVFAELDPVALVLVVKEFWGGVSMPEEGVYRADSEVALVPAEADADAEKEVLAAAPLAPEDALLWM